MPGRSVSVLRMMIIVGICAVGIATFRAMTKVTGAIGPAALAMVLVTIIGVERAIFSQKRRVFWRGFAVTCLLFVGSAFVPFYFGWFAIVRRFLLDHGPIILRARDDRMFALHRAYMERQNGSIFAPPPLPSELELLCSALTEVFAFLVIVSAAAATCGVALSLLTFAWRRFFDRITT